MSRHTETVVEEDLSYSARVQNESTNPSNMVRMAEPDAFGIIHGCCGDTMEIYLRCAGETIKEATFMTDGRESAVACGSMLTKLLQGMPLKKAASIMPEDLIAALDGLPKPKIHCAKLTLNTLHEAIAHWRPEEKPREG